MTSRSIGSYRACNENAPLDLVRESAEWTPVIRLIDAWAKEKLGPNSGYSSEELDKLSWALIYWWLTGCACRTAEAAERVFQSAPAHPRVR